MSSPPLVSVVVPTYNRAHCVGNAIDSILNQTRPNVEVIVVDDGSTDGTHELFHQKYGGEKRVRYVPQSNKGPTAAHNRGFSLVTGDFVALLDSDDVWKPFKLEIQLACFQAFPELGMIWTNMEAVNPAGKVVHPGYLKKMYNCYSKFTLEEIFNRTVPLGQILPDAPPAISSAFLCTGDIYRKMFFGSLVHTSTVVLRRERFDKVKSFNEDLKITGEDFDFHLRTCEQGPVGLVDLACIEYQVGMADQLTNPKLMVYGSKNCLTTITAALKRSPERLKFTRREMRHRFADVHEWIGEASLDYGDRSEARKHLLKSLLLSPMQWRTARLLALSMTPAKVGDSIRAFFRQIKRIFLPGRAGNPTSRLA